MDESSLLAGAPMSYCYLTCHHDTPRDRALEAPGAAKHPGRCSVNGVYKKAGHAPRQV
jgi:hypothetical protein